MLRVSNTSIHSPLAFSPRVEEALQQENVLTVKGGENGLIWSHIAGALALLH